MSYISPEAELEEIRRLGEIRDTPPLPADYDPFSGSVEPFPLDPADFREHVEAALEFIPLGEDIDFDQLVNGIVLEEK